MRQTLIQVIVATHEARENCRRSNNQEWAARHTSMLQQLYTLLPSGSGIDNGTRVTDVSAARVKLECSYHHMNDTGHYDGWTEHVIRVTPTFAGIDVKVSGPDRNGVRDYLGDVYHHALTHPVIPVVDGQDVSYRFTADEEAK